MMTTKVVGLVLVALLAGGATVSACASSPEEAVGEETGVPEAGARRDARTDVASPDVTELEEDAATTDPDADADADALPDAAPICTDTPLGANCIPTSTICCDLGSCERRADTGIRRCCHRPTAFCRNDDDCCGYVACDFKARKCLCQANGAPCRSHSECCSEKCSGGATGTDGVCE
jgi:hypothetical protein